MEEIRRGQDLLRQLRQLYKHNTKIAVAVGIYRKKLPGIEAGTCQASLLKRFIESAERVLGVQGETVLATTVVGTVETLGGETSPLGVRYVLGPASYREIEAGELREFLPLLTRSIERARAMLNIASQFSSEASRTRLQSEAAEEVEELELAIRLFTTKVPSRLTDLHQAQRDTWFQEVKSDSKRKNRRRQ
jgi:hypothetical protein